MIILQVCERLARQVLDMTWHVRCYRCLFPDRRALVDFSYEFGPLQTKIFMATSIPVTVSAVVYNTHPTVPFYRGHTNFRLTLWLHTQEDLIKGELTSSFCIYRDVMFCGLYSFTGSTYTYLTMYRIHFFF